jgi:two-component sensor histidine kinase
LAHLADKATEAWTGALGEAFRNERNPVPSATEGPFLGSRYERLASYPEELPFDAGNVLSLLLDAPSSINSIRPFLMPIWAEEAMHRAYAMLRLLGSQSKREIGRVQDRITAHVEYALARELARTYQSLSTAGEEEIVPCSALFREMVLNLGTLFGSGGNIAISARIKPLNLPAYKRRALALCTSELMINALTHAFADASGGRLDVCLRPQNCERWSLRVADNGVGFQGRYPDTKFGVAGGLAGLLEAELTYYRTSSGITIAEVVFLVGAQSAMVSTE